MARLMTTLAGAMHYAHQHGALHRDLKPSNILIDANGEPHLTDIGLAKRLDGDSDLTVTGQMLGWPNYAAPEQFDSRVRRLDGALASVGEGHSRSSSPSSASPRERVVEPPQSKVDTRSVVYSLGAILYHLLTSRPQFVAETIEETLPRVRTTEPAAPRSLNADASVDLETICLKWTVGD